MAITYGFYNSLNGDRKYNATDFTKIFDGIIQDGVFQTIGDHFLVSQNTGSDNTCRIGTGKAWLSHTYTINDTIKTLSFDMVSSLTSRIDAVIIDVDIQNRTNDIIIKKGTAAANPTKPELINESNHKQYALAYITLKGSENITSGGVEISVVKNENIENNIGANNNVDATHPVLPYVLGAMQAVTETEFILQTEARILNWFENMRDQLSTDAAVNLQNEIDDLIVVGVDPLTDISQLDNGKIYLQYEE